MNFRQKLALFFGLFGFLCLLLPNTATADSFDWTYQGTMLNTPSGILDSGGGELTTTGGVITGVSGTFNGLAITALLSPGTFFGNDNALLIPPAPLYLTTGGFSFLDSAGEFNIYGIFGTPCTCVYGSVGHTGVNISDIGNFTLTPTTATPEPAVMAMLLPSVVGFGLLLGWKRLRLSHRSAESLP